MKNNPTEEQLRADIEAAFDKLPPLIHALAEKLAARGDVTAKMRAENNVMTLTNFRRLVKNL